MSAIVAWGCHQWDRDRYILLLLTAPHDVIQCELAIIERPSRMSLKVFNGIRQTWDNIGRTVILHCATGDDKVARGRARCA